MPTNNGTGVLKLNGAQHSPRSSCARRRRRFDSLIALVCDVDREIEQTTQEIEQPRQRR